MTREEVMDALSEFNSAFPGFAGDDPRTQLDVWAHHLASVPSGKGARLVASWIANEPKAPTIAAFLHQWHVLRRLEQAQPRTEAEALAIVDGLLAEEERAKLAPPPTAQTGRELARESIASMRAMIDGSRRPQSRADLIRYHLAKQGPHAPGACYGGLCRSLGIDLSEVPA